MFTHITKLLFVSFECFLSISAFSVKVSTKNDSGSLSLTHLDEIFKIGFDDFLFRYWLYFLQLIIPLLSKSLAALLNSSKDKDSDFISFALNFGFGSR